MSNDILDISLWPNSEGTLGDIKVAIPDGVTTKWPEGDALVENFVYKDGKLVGLVDTKALTENESKSTVIPYDFVDITVNKRLETSMTFNAGERCKHLNINYEVMLPDGYKRLAYLEGTGTQYILTEGDVTPDTGVRIEYEQPSKDRLEEAVGTRGKNSAEKDVWWFVPRQYKSLTEQQGYYYSIYYTYLPNWGRVTAEMNFKGSSKIKVQSRLGDEREYNLPTAQEVTLPPLKLWGSGTNYHMIGRIWYCEISNGSNIDHFYIPALDTTYSPCMYDIISGETFYSETGEPFIYPGMEQQASTYSLRNRMYAKMTKHGVQHLFHVPEGYSGTKEDYASEYGFKELVTSPMPTEGYWKHEWTETDTQLIRNWIETEAPTEA